MKVYNSNILNFGCGMNTSTALGNYAGLFMATENTEKCLCNLHRSNEFVSYIFYFLALPKDAYSCTRKQVASC